MYACIPVYDRYFIKGFKKVTNYPCSFNKINLRRLETFYMRHESEFKKF